MAVVGAVTSDRYSHLKALIIHPRQFYIWSFEKWLIRIKRVCLVRAAPRYIFKINTDVIWTWEKKHAFNHSSLLLVSHCANPESSFIRSRHTLQFNSEHASFQRPLKRFGICTSRNMAEIVSVITRTHDVTYLRHYRGHVLHTWTTQKYAQLAFSDEYTQRDTT